MDEPTNTDNEGRSTEDLVAELRAARLKIADLAATAVDNARLVDTARRGEAIQARPARQATLTADVGTALTHEQSLDAMLQRCAEAVVKHLDAAFARVWTANDAEQVLELRASAGMYVELP